MVGDAVRRNQGKVDGDEVKPCVGEHLLTLVMISKSKEMSWLRNDLTRTTTHPMVRLTERLAHRHRLSVMQMLCARSANAKQVTTDQTTEKE